MHNKQIFIFGFITLLLACLLSNNTYAATSKKNNPTSTELLKLDDNKPINIKSNSLAVLTDKKYAFFKGNVIVTQADITLKADEMHVFSYFDEKTKKNTFKRIECYGNVNFKSATKNANSQKAIYYVTEGLLELTKEVFLQDGQNTIQGERFIYEVKTGKTSINSNANSSDKNNPEEDINQLKKGLLSNTGGRVKATLVPGGSIEKIEMPSPPPSLKKKFEKPEKKSN